MLPLGENLHRSVPIAVDSKVEQFSNALDYQLWNSFGLGRQFTDTPKQSPQIQRQLCMYHDPHSSYYS